MKEHNANSIVNTPSFPSLAEAIQTLYGNNIRIETRRSVSGGDCNDAYELQLSDGSRLFMKSNDIRNLLFFTSEADGLAAIAKTGCIGVPNVYCAGTDDTSNASFLLMEVISQGRPSNSFWEDFGRAFANMHAFDPSDMVSGGAFGWDKDNIIGFRPQINTPHDTWVSFYRDCRILPQVTDAYQAGLLSDQDRRDAERVMERLDGLLVEPKHPSLLHGDLWSRNFMVNKDGDAMLIDPAVYVGHPEADLAMTRLFGGFHDTFYRAYAEVFPLQDGVNDRMDLYHLYQLLNHLNQFGASYLSSVRRILQRFS